MSCFHNRPTKPTFLPPPPRESEITAEDIEAYYQGYQTLRWDIRERYYFQEYLLMYVFFYKKENENSLSNNQQCTSRKEIKELQISVGGEEEKELHQEDRMSLPSDSEKYEETSHEYEYFFIENTEDKFDTHATLEMKQRASTDGCLNYEGVPTDGCSQLYVCDIEIIFESVYAIQSSHNHEYEYLVRNN